jgi:hypothetical protein
MSKSLSQKTAEQQSGSGKEKKVVKKKAGPGKSWPLLTYEKHLV